MIIGNVPYFGSVCIGDDAVRGMCLKASELEETKINQLVTNNINIRNDVK